MNTTFIQHSSFLVETDRFYFLFDYESGPLPQMDGAKPIFVMVSHGHFDHYSPEVFPLLAQSGMQKIRAVLSDDIEAPANVDVLSVSPGREYQLDHQLTVSTFQSTDLGVAFLIDDAGTLIYFAGDLNDWVWEEESDGYNQEMTANYRAQIHLLEKKLDHRQIDAAFVVLDPRQERFFHRGMCYFLENIPAKAVYPMHTWGNPGIIDAFLKDYPQYEPQIQNTALCAEKR